MEGIDLLVAEPLDVEGVPRGEVLELLDHLRRADQPAGAAAHRVRPAGLGVDVAHRMAAAGRADVGEDEGRRILRPPREVDVDDLRDDVAGALHGDEVADAEVLAVADRLAVGADALDVVLVVERGIGHHHAADGDRLEPRHRGQRPGPPDLDVDAAEEGLRLFGRELVGDRPARAARYEAEPGLEIEAVDLVDDAVDVVAERRPARLLLAIEGQRLVDAAAHPHPRVGRQSPIRRSA